MGTGVSPATDFLKESGFSLEKDGGIAVDEYLRVKGHKNIYAIGDISHYPQYPEKQQRRVEHWNVAGNHVSRPSHRCCQSDTDLVSPGSRGCPQHRPPERSRCIHQSTRLLVFRR